MGTQSLKYLLPSLLKEKFAELLQIVVVFWYGELSILSVSNLPLKYDQC